MTRSPRALHVEAQDVLLAGRMAEVVIARDWELLREVARLAKEDAPIALAATDPARYRALRDAVTRFHIAGWSAMTPKRVEEVAQEYVETKRQRPKPAIGRAAR